MSSVGLTIELELLRDLTTPLAFGPQALHPLPLCSVVETVLFVFTLPHPRSILQRRALRLSGLDCGSGL